MVVKASEFIAQMKKHLGDGYVYGSVGQICTIALLQKKQRQYGSALGNGYYQLNGDYTKGKCAIWLGKWVADCSGLIKGVRRDMTGVFRDVSAQGTYDQCWKTGTIGSMPLVPGCCVFKWYSSKHRMGHVGMYIGDGFVIESANVKVGVIKTKLKGWSHWGLLEWLTHDLPLEPNSPGDAGGDLDYPGDYTGPKPGDPPYPGNLPPQVGLGSTGSAVKTLQTQLNAKGANPQLAVDGIFGPKTLEAVLKFQRANGLDDDGIVGPLTWTQLLRTGEDSNLPPTVKFGNRGANVEKLQKLLNAKGAKPALDVDGIFGTLTLSAVYAFQKKSGLAVDGIVGPKTWKALLG